MLNVEISAYGISQLSYIHAQGSCVLLGAGNFVLYATRAELAPVLFPVEYGFVAQYNEHALDCDGCDDCISADEFDAKYPAYTCDHNYSTSESYNRATDKWEVYCSHCQVTIAEFERQADYR